MRFKIPIPNYLKNVIPLVGMGVGVILMVALMGYIDKKTISFSVVFLSIWTIISSFQSLNAYQKVREKILCLLIIFVALDFLFSSIYYFVYLVKPNSYSISNTIQQGKYQSEYNSVLEDYLVLNKKILFVEAMASVPQLVLNTLEEAKTRNGETNYVDINNMIKFKMEHFAIATDVTVAVGYTLSFKFKNEKEIKIFESEFNRASQSALSNTIGNAHNVSEMYIQIKQLIINFKEEQEQVQNQLSKYLLLNADLNYLDFLYFSTITITTTGYGDITPNSTIVRLVVIIQTLIGVFFIAYALTIIKG